MNRPETSQNKPRPVNLPEVMSALDSFFTTTKDYFLLDDEEADSMRTYFLQELQSAMLRRDPRAVDNTLTALSARMLQHFTQNPKIAEMVSIRITEGVSISGVLSVMSPEERQKAIHQKTREILNGRGREFVRQLHEALAGFTPDHGEVDQNEQTALYPEADRRPTHVLPGGNGGSGKPFELDDTWPALPNPMARGPRGTMVIRRPQIPEIATTPLTSAVSVQGAQSETIQPQRKNTRTRVLVAVGAVLAASAVATGAVGALQRKISTGDTTASGVPATQPSGSVAPEKDAGTDSGAAVR